MSAYTVSSIPSTVVTWNMKPEEKEPQGMYAIGIVLVIIIVVVVLAVTHKQILALAQASLTPHYVQIPPPEAAVVSAQPPFGEQYPVFLPMESLLVIFVSQVLNIIQPVCLKHPCNIGPLGILTAQPEIPDYPLCKDTQLHPLAAYRF